MPATKFSIKIGSDVINVRLHDGQIHILDEAPPRVETMTAFIQMLRERGIEIKTPYDEFHDDWPAERIALQFCLCG